MKVLGVVAVLAALSACAETSTTTASAPRIPSDATRVTLAVGETKPIDAIRASQCGSPAPTWAEVQSDLPVSNIISYSDGGLSSRNSESCNRSVETRVVNGTGTAIGTEVLELDNLIAVIVR